ncbi:MAG: AbrB/MazE/SpoVT family DNA-binding domain-containing protein [Propionibacteriaceae bacterium]|jgi:AbrB family looped-hinge helix DNA binding protein|nr:AbrB/MazE/SpoVT family DNA-binding domain-containing protein [Propionibacteriaceae bacterium]
MPKLTATISSKGQVVVPAQLRRQLGLHPGDTVSFEDTDSGQAVTMRRRETWDEMSTRFHSWIAPGTPPLEDAHGFYDTREPRP